MPDREMTEQQALRAKMDRLAAEEERSRDVLARHKAALERKRRARARTYALLSQATLKLTKQVAQLEQVATGMEGLAERIVRDPRVQAALADLVRRERARRAARE